MLYLDICPHIKRWNKITKILSFLLCFSLTGQKPPSRNVDEFLSLLWSWKKRKLMGANFSNYNLPLKVFIFRIGNFLEFLTWWCQKMLNKLTKTKGTKIKIKVNRNHHSVFFSWCNFTATAISDAISTISKIIERVTQKKLLLVNGS